MSNMLHRLAASSPAFCICDAQSQRQLPHPTNLCGVRQPIMNDEKICCGWTISYSSVAPGGFDVRLVQADQRRARGLQSYRLRLLPRPVSELDPAPVATKRYIHTHTYQTRLAVRDAYCVCILPTVFLHPGLLYTLATAASQPRCSTSLLLNSISTSTFRRVLTRIPRLDSRYSPWAPP